MRRLATTVLPLIVLSMAAPSYAADVTTGPLCSNEYADDFSVLISKARELEEKSPSYTFCLRSTATYECPSYGSDGNLRKKKQTVVAHGTGFAYRQQNGETYLMTNEHVAEWPLVTDSDHPAEKVPPGCKRVRSTVAIVDNESDSYHRDDIQLSPVVTDAAMDISILKTKTQLPIMPWKIGHSGGLKERNIVDIRGFPLGVFKATNAGKVIAAYDRDEYQDWNHIDFVVDALLSPGNSGSPVLAISCKTGEFELVGVYHAGYTAGSALNVVIGIDQIRDLMTTLKKAPPVPSASRVVLDRSARDKVLAHTRASLESFFPMGSLTAAVRAHDPDVLYYEVMSKGFPVKSYPAFVLEDLPVNPRESFGTLGRVWIGNRQGLKLYDKASLAPETQQQFENLLDALRTSSLAAADYRLADKDAESSREKYDNSKKLEKALHSTASGYADLLQNVLEIAEKRGPQSKEESVDVHSIFQKREEPGQKEAAPSVARNSDAPPALTR